MVTAADSHKTWPRPFLLTLYTQAIEHGFVWVEPISAPDAYSLKMSLYRLRRRSDKSNASIIPPEYHLVVAGEWEPGPLDNPDAGKFPVVYNLLPDGDALPQIIPGDGTALGSYKLPQALPVTGPAVSIESIEALAPMPDLETGDVEDFIASMVADAKKKAAGDD